MFTHNGITLRVIEERDLEKLRHLRNDPSTWMNLTDIVFLDKDAQGNWFKGLASKTDRKYFAVSTPEHDFLGVVRMDEIDRPNRSIRVGCDIMVDQRGKGYGSKAFDAILKYCFDFQNMHRVWLLVLDFNEAGKKLYSKKAFQVEGRYRDAIYRDGRYHDYILMSVLEPEYRRAAKG